MLQEFFAVTMTSVYHAQSASPPERVYPCATKIMLRGHSSFPVGHKLSKSDGMIAIGKNLIGYFPERHGVSSPLTGVERDISRVSTNYHGDISSPIVALFFNQEGATECFNSADLKPCDIRWIEQTRQVLDAIDENHPAFFIRQGEDALIPA